MGLLCFLLIPLEMYLLKYMVKNIDFATCHITTS